MGSREIITFQFGNYSNYIGAHWWNIQESYFQYNISNTSEIHHDVLFREGKSLKDEVTFTPRLILLDDAENIANTPVLTETPVNLSQIVISDNENVLIQEQEVPEKHEFIKDLEKIEHGQQIDIARKDYNFEETTRNWSDFLRTKYHPKSVCSFPNSFQTEVFQSGFEIYSSLQEDFVERVRNYMEECDNLQGFQVIVDATDAFAGFADSALLHLQDEYASKTVLTFPALSGRSVMSNSLDDIKRSINILLTYQKLTENSSLLVPIGTNKTAWRTMGPPTAFPNIVYDNGNSYHTSAILASFLDTVSLKYRLREDYNSLSDVVSGLNYYNKKVCAASISLPFPMAPGDYLLNTLENLDDSLPLWSELTPGCDILNDTIFYQRITVRGIPVARLRNLSTVSQNSRAHSCTRVEELVHLYLSYRMSTISNVSSSDIPLKTALPYPQIFIPRVSPTGAIDKTATRMENFNVESCPVVAGLHCCKGVSHMLDSLHRCVKSVNMKRFHHFFGAHMDVDEFNECLEKILSMGFGSANDIELS